MRAAIVVAMLAVLAPGLARAQAGAVVISPEDARENDPAGTALVEAFATFCLDRFPSARVEDVAPGRVQALSPARVREYLHDDPGHGWLYRAPDGEYVLTIEDPPYHTCAVRRTYARPPHYRLPWLLQTGTWAAKAGRGPFQPSEPQVVRQNGLLIEASGRMLPGGGGDVFLELKTTYPDGHFEQRLARRVIGR